MAEVGLEIRSCDLEGPSSKSLVFQVMTPWHQELRIWKLRQVYLFKTLTPTVFLEHLKKREVRELILLIECRLTTASPDDLRVKQPGEELAGMVLPFNLYDLIMMNERLPLQTTLPIIDIFQNREVASAVVHITCNFWPNFHQSLRLLSPDLGNEIMSSVRHGVEIPRHLFLRTNDSPTALEVSKDFSFLDQYSMNSPNSSTITDAQDENGIAASQFEDDAENVPQQSQSSHHGRSPQLFSTIQQLLVKTRLSVSTKVQPLSPSGAANTPPRLRRLRENIAMETSGAVSPQMFSTVPKLVMRGSANASRVVTKTKGSLRRRYFLNLASLELPLPSPSRSAIRSGCSKSADGDSDPSSTLMAAKDDEEADSDSDSDAMFEISDQSDDELPVNHTSTPTSLVEN